MLAPNAVAEPARNVAAVNEGSASIGIGPRQHQRAANGLVRMPVPRAHRTGWWWPPDVCWKAGDENEPAVEFALPDTAKVAPFEITTCGMPRLLSLATESPAATIDVQRQRCWWYHASMPGRSC